ncbi:nucleolar complex protein 2 homolog [Octopus bimaculoides]|nr:nucleolar complex protein 2 homolog [Octopus bimaculoides]
MSTAKSRKRAYIDVESRFENIGSSDDSDVSDDEGNSFYSKSLVSEKLIEEWQDKISKPTPTLLHDIIDDIIGAFAGAVEQIQDKSDDTKIAVKNITVFNDLVKLCLLKIEPSLQSILNLPPTKDIRHYTKPNKSSKWKTVSADVKVYLSSLVKMLKNISETSMIDILLKHVHKMAIYFSMSNRLSKDLVEHLITVWGSAEDTTRILAFLCINKLIIMRDNSILELCLKRMYAEYVSNCKFTSPTLLPNITFMQRSLVEILKIDEKVTYQHAFVYIHQQAIHLRNALTLKKKDLCQTVYNWQYIRCLELWSTLVSSSPQITVLENLIYPLIEVITGVIKLVLSVRFYPLHFHCIAMLNKISASTSKFIPTLPFILETLEYLDLNKKCSKVALKPICFTYVLKMTKSQVQEKTFKDTVIEQVYEHMLTCLNIVSHSISFPELVFPAQIQIKDVLKNCKVPNYSKQLKQLYEKIEENSKFISTRRNSFSLNLSDTKAINSWERQCKEQVPPILKFFRVWRKLCDGEIAHQVAAKDSIIDFGNFEDIRAKKEPIKKATQQEKREFSALFDSVDKYNFEDIFKFDLKKNADSKKKKAGDNEKNINGNAQSKKTKTSDENEKGNGNEQKKKKSSDRKKDGKKIKPKSVTGKKKKLNRFGGLKMI